MFSGSFRSYRVELSLIVVEPWRVPKFANGLFDNGFGIVEVRSDCFLSVHLIRLHSR